MNKGDEMREYSYIDANPEIIVKMTETCVLDSIDEEHLVGLLKLSKVRQYEPGEMIIKEGEFDDCIYMLLSGKVRVVKKGFSLCVLERTGDIFGEMAVITGSARSATVYAAERADCLAMNASYMYSLSDVEKLLFITSLFRIFVEVLTKRLKVMNEKFVESSQVNDGVKAGSDVRRRKGVFREAVAPTTRPIQRNKK